MEIRENENVYIIAPICSKLDHRKSSKIISKIMKESRNVAIDLRYVQDCGIEFIESIKNLSTKKIGIFNIPSDIFVLFNIMDLDKSAELFVSELDFKEKSRQLINRKFVVI